MSGIFLSSPKVTRQESVPPKKVAGLTKATASGPRISRREEITRTVCPTPSVAAQQRLRFHASQPCSPMLSPRSPRKSGSTYPCSPETSFHKVPSHGGYKTGKGENDEATKTMTAIDEALQAVKTALKADWRDCRRRRLNKSNLDRDCPSPSLSVNEDVESLFGTESTVSTACTSTLSEDGQRRLSSLEDARRMLKEHVCAEERSMRFTHGLVAKLDEVRTAIEDARRQS